MKFVLQFRLNIAYLHK